MVAGAAVVSIRPRRRKSACEVGGFPAGVGRGLGVMPGVLFDELPSGRAFDEYRDEVTDRAVLECGVVTGDGLVDLLGGQLRELLGQPGSDMPKRFVLGGAALPVCCVCHGYGPSLAPWVAGVGPVHADIAGQRG